MIRMLKEINNFFKKNYPELVPYLNENSLLGEIVRTIAEYQMKWLFYGVRFDQKEYEHGEYLPFSYDFRETRDFPDYGDIDSEEFEELDGVSTWAFYTPEEQFKLEGNIKTEFNLLLKGGLRDREYLTLVGSDKMKHGDDEDEWILKPGICVKQFRLS